MGKTELKKPARAKASEPTITAAEANAALKKQAASEAKASAAEAEAAPEPIDEAAEPPVKIPGFDPAHLTGQLGDYLLTEVKMARHVKPWDQLKEHEQRSLIDRQYSKARALVQAVGETIASKGFKSAPFAIDSTTIKEGLKVVLTGPATEAAMMSIARNKGALVQLVFADTDEFGGAMISKPAPDQPDMLAGEPEPENEADEDDIDPETGEIRAPILPDAVPPQAEPPAPAP